MRSQPWRNGTASLLSFDVQRSALSALRPTTARRIPPSPASSVAGLAYTSQEVMQEDPPSLTLGYRSMKLGRPFVWWLSGPSRPTNPSPFCRRKTASQNKYLPNMQRM